MGVMPKLTTASLDAMGAPRLVRVMGGAMVYVLAHCWLKWRRQRAHRLCLLLLIDTLEFFLIIEGAHLALELLRLRLITNMT